MDESVVDRILREFASGATDIVTLVQRYHTDLFQAAWLADPRLYRIAGRRLIGVGEALAAFELVNEGVASHPADPELLYLSALALARGGNLTKAKEYLDELLALPKLGPIQRVEALSLAGKLAKERYRLGDAEGRVRLAAESAELYQSAFEIDGSSFPAINAATMSLLAGKSDAYVRHTAQVALDEAQKERQASGKQDNYWLLATIGEAKLLLGNHEEAAAWYRDAVAKASGAIGEVATMRRQVRLLEHRLSGLEPILKILDVGTTIVFAGHMFDRPGSASARLHPRFPFDPRFEERVRKAIAAELDDLNPAVGYCCGACGSDLLFAELMIERQKEVHLVLPFSRTDFYESSVDFGLTECAEYRRRFDAVAERAQIHYGTEESYLGDEGLLEFVNDFAQGLTLVHAAELDSEPWCLVVLDDASVAGRGGTRHFLERWEDQGRKSRKINLSRLRDEVQPQPPAWWSMIQPATLAKPQRAIREIKSMLFADVTNYSSLTDAQTPAFFIEFLSQVAEVIQTMRRYPAMCNTWGDGLFVVFNEVADAADFALQLLQKVEQIDFSGLGLPAGMTVRIGLHSGPVYPQWDRLIGRLNFFGTHVNRAARIEPKTAPGCIYASEQFAALLATEDEHDFVSEYVGVHLLGKAHDRFRCRLYRLSRKMSGISPALPG